ncbi:peptidylprolyl isomerase [Ramlibacter algicola]|uniref:Peptidyl-prolyl cis-trans isomerase n=1 Tax=Ramlibacter algicola TaxID=2795217 RepID=A0A934Q160_9BURK|nr:peptidylprolyl isomerase [Ramlibacter algicola]MBK0392956.1 peptidyl-prolyl cis-trans isomerase [Ramlibacter algicola]
MALVSRRAAAALLLCGAAAFAHAADAPRVKLATSMGDIVVEVYPDKAPKTAENFLTYVREKRYDGTIFHRVINGFMVQGGGYSKDLWEKPTRPPIPLEIRKDLPNARGTIAMARTPDPNSATGQFFINVVDNSARLGPREGSAGYAVFGKVVSGMEVVDKIKAVRTGPKGEHANVPLQPIVIESATLVK